MPNLLRLAGYIFAFILGTAEAASAQIAQSIESELVLITPVGKTLSDSALREFAKYAKERWVPVSRQALSQSELPPLMAKFSNGKADLAPTFSGAARACFLIGSQNRSS